MKKTPRNESDYREKAKKRKADYRENAKKDRRLTIEKTRRRWKTDSGENVKTTKD